MPRTAVPKSILPGNYPVAGVLVTEQAADTVSLNQSPLTGKEIVVARNTDGAAAHNVSITSTPDFQGRSQHITLESVPLSGVKAYGPFATSGWQQADGNLYFSSDSALVKFSILQIP